MEQSKEHTKTDEELLSLFYKDGNNYWLGNLLERYTLLMLGVCLKYLKWDEARYFIMIITY